MKLLQKYCLVTVTLLLGVFLISCGDGNGSDSPIDLVVIIGRNANTNVFPERFFREPDGISKHIERAVNGGCIAVISSDGNPRSLFEMCYKTEPNRVERQKKNESRKNSIMAFLRSEETAKDLKPENDLLKAIQVGYRQLNAFGSDREKRLIIMNNGIVTTGEFDFNAPTFGITKFDFKTSRSEVEAFAAGIAERLNANGELPNLGDINITFMGLGDVAPPQDELSMKVREGLIILWQKIFEKCGVPASQIDIKDWPSNTGKPNEGLPPVTPVFFFSGIIEIPDSLVTFEFGKATYKNPQAAERILREFADEMKEYIRRNEGVKIYVVGSESKDQNRAYTTTLSENRAKTVMGTLTKFGVPTGRMEAFGLAVDLPRRENEWKNGTFDPIIGARNQKVVLIPSTIEDQPFLQEVLAVRDNLYKRR